MVADDRFCLNSLIVVPSLLPPFLPMPRRGPVWPGISASEASSSCRCRSMCLWAALRREWDPTSRESLSPLITRLLPVLKKQDVKNGLSRTFDPACKIPATLTLPCWRSMYGPQRRFQWNVISNQWPTRRHANTADCAGKPSRIKNGQRTGGTYSASFPFGDTLWLGRHWTEPQAIWLLVCLQRATCARLPPSIQGRSQRGWRLRALPGLKSPTSCSSQRSRAGDVQAWFTVSSMTDPRVTRPFFEFVNKHGDHKRA